MEKTLLSEFMSSVKDNKKYRTLSDDIVKKEILSYLKKNPDIHSVEKISVKEIRANLHRIYSSYQTKKKNKRYIYLEELKFAVEQKDRSRIYEITKKLLSMTLSTIERLDDYSIIYEKIFEETGSPKTIVDLGCGLNPLSYPLMRLGSLKYHCYDIDTNDITFLNDYFKVMSPLGLDGHAKIMDAEDLSKIKDLPASDIIFMFKLLDLINLKKKDILEELLGLLKKKTEYIVVSFSTVTLTRKKMALTRRSGFESILEKNDMGFKSFETGSELFYIIRCN